MNTSFLFCFFTSSGGLEMIVFVNRRKKGEGGEERRK